MSHYCVSDVHGRYDLLMQGLNELSFNHKKDKLYILGDVCNIGPDSLKIYDFILNNQNSITLIKGNHDVFLVEILKAYQEVIKYPELLNILKEYVINYVSGFEKNRTQACRETSKYATTNRRKICVETFKKFVVMSKQINIENWHLLVSFYESFYNTRKLMLELVDNPYYDYNTLINFINQCKSIKSITINKEKWVMYHSRYSDKQNNHPNIKNQIIDRLNKSYNSNNVNYIYGHTPIPKLHTTFTNEILNYNLIFKAIDYKNNKYYNIDVSHYGICFFNLETLQEIYVGKCNDKKDFHSCFSVGNYTIEDITAPYSRIKRYLIKFKEYFLAIAIFNKKEKKFSAYEFCELFQESENEVELIIHDNLNMKDILNLFINNAPLNFLI